MKKHILTFACLALFVGSCSSDDTTTPPQKPKPTYEKQYFITEIKTITYVNEVNTKPNGSSDVTSTLGQSDQFKLTYTNDYKLQALSDFVTLYTEDQIEQTYTVDYNFTLDENNRLKTMESRSANTLINQMNFSYKNHLLQSYTTKEEGQRLELIFTYNEADQFIQSLVRPYGVQFDFAYNKKNQLISMAALGLKIEFGYSEGKNPFVHLPFDMTTLLFEELDLIPLTYHFANPLNTLISPDNENFEIEYTLNEDHYPVKATMYEIIADKKVVYRELQYTYTIREIEVTKPLN